MTAAAGAGLGPSDSPPEAEPWQGAWQGVPLAARQMTPQQLDTKIDEIRSEIDVLKTYRRNHPNMTAAQLDQYTTRLDQWMDYLNSFEGVRDEGRRQMSPADEVRLFAVDRNSEGHTCIKRIQLTEKLLKLNHEYPLSRLWLMGQLRAVPNV